VGHDGDDGGGDALSTVIRSVIETTTSIRVKGKEGVKEGREYGWCDGRDVLQDATHSEGEK